MALATTKKAAPKGGKLGGGKTKPAKAAKTAAKPKAEPKVKFAVGDAVEFVGYASENEDPTFEPGDALKVVAIGKDDDNKPMLACVKAEDYEAYQENEDSVVGEELSPSEIKKAASVPVDPYKFSLSDDERVEEALAAHDGDALAAAKDALETINESTFLLGGFITKLYYEQKFRTYGKKGQYDDDEIDGKKKAGSGWNKFCRENFGFDGRKGEAMMRIYRNFNGLGDVIDLDEVSANKKIGYVKLNAMAGVIDKSNAAELIAKADSMNLEDFRNVLKTDYVGSDGSSSSTRESGARMPRLTMKFQFFADQSAGVTEVINAVAKKHGWHPEKNLPQILELIIMTYAAENLSETDNAKASRARQTALKDFKTAGGTKEQIAERNNSFKHIMKLVEGGGENEAEETDEADEAGEDDAPAAAPKKKLGKKK